MTEAVIVEYVKAKSENNSAVATAAEVMTQLATEAEAEAVVNTKSEKKAAVAKVMVM